MQSGDTHRTIFDQCEQITRRFEQISSSFDGWSRTLRNLRDFKSQWQQFVQDARNVRNILFSRLLIIFFYTIEKVHRFDLNIVPSTNTSLDNVERYQRLLTEFASRAQVGREISSGKCSFFFVV